MDLVSAGMTRKECAALKGSSLNIMEKWNILKPYWEVCRHTGYGQSLQIAVREIYGIDAICTETIEAFGRRIPKRFWRTPLSKSPEREVQHQGVNTGYLGK